MADEHDLRLTLVEGLHCASCVARAEQVLRDVPGVRQAEVNLSSREARLRYDASATTVATIKTRLHDAGFVPEEEAEHSGHDHRQHGSGERRRALVALLLAAPVLVLGMMHLHQPWSLWLQAGLTAAIIAGPGRGIFATALRGLPRLILGMDTLIALGAGAASALSVVALLFPAWWPGVPPIHFESAAAIVALVLTGRWLESRARAGTAAALETLLARRPPVATRLSGDDEEQVLAASLRSGDRVRVRTGETMPVDGVVERGSGQVDEAMMTGESAPVAKAAADMVTGGTVLVDGSLVVRATRVGADSVLARLVEQVRTAQDAKPPIARLADRLSAHFVPLVVALALLTWVLWTWLAPGLTAHALLAAASVLVIACPCALGLATPTAVMVAVGHAARSGLLIRDGAALESAATVDLVAFDKTGTLTVGRPTVERVLAEPGFDEARVLALAAAAEQGSEHPLAQAVRLAAATHDRPVATVSGFRSVAGQGVEAEVDGRRVVVGSARFLRSLAVEAPLLNLALDGTSALFVAVDGRVAGLIALADAVKPGAAEAVAGLRARGIRVVMVTGDQPAVAERVARAVGIDEVHAAQLPGDKLALLQRWQAEGRRVAMIGDGINDAPALAAAHVGVAMAGTDAANAIAAAAGDVVLLNRRVDGVAALIDLSRATRRAIRQNLAGASVYNLLALPLAAGMLYPWTGWMLDPMLAAGAMALSSLTVVGNSLRLAHPRKGLVG
jgi:Cu+-exporting ATPase